MGVSSKTSSSNYTPKTSDDASLDSASTMVDKQETKIRNFSTSPAKRTRQRSALSFRRPILLSDSNSAPSASTCHIRQRYLSKLGVAEAASPKSKSNSNSKKKLKPVLKSSDASSLKPTSPKPNVRFQTQVSVQIIPDKHVPNKDLWLQKDEFQELFQRGCLEYAADGWSWEHATEESDFLWYKNELVHPAHFRHNSCTMQRHFLMNMYAQRQSGF